MSGVGRNKVHEQIPDCVAATYDQLVRGIQILDLGHGAHVHLFPSVKDILLFLCCRDKQRENAHALWNEVRRLKGAGIAYEMEAADLLTDTVNYVIDYEGLTRSELRARDDEVAKAALNLYTALAHHSCENDFYNFIDESSAANWPEEYMTYIARMLYGMPCSNDHFLAFNKGHPFDRIDWPNAPLPSRDERLFWMLCHGVPTMMQMLDVLMRRASELSSARLDAKKERQSRGDASDTRFIRRLVAALNRRNPDAPADQIARIVSPIVDSVVGGKTLARCKKVAQRLKRDLKADGTISPS